MLCERNREAWLACRLVEVEFRFQKPKQEKVRSLFCKIGIRKNRKVYCCKFCSRILLDVKRTPPLAANPTMVSQNGTAFHNECFSANQHRGITAEGSEEAGAIQQSSSSRIFYSVRA
ncbi:hypothetical protein CEXT_227631 [Caerostris extrusa]|uniref:Uncharacterized protein n=1 Tax=Caerostris extrusa TaxID=172846 RepID=A0AAV4QVC3_CAEEX|nr:hypothetical protein CEXT_227631 [Caerostris extrusa]